MEVAFVVLNSFLVGLGCGGVWYLKATRSEMRDLRDQSAKIRDECLGLTKTISDAHNSLASKVLEIADKQKGQELRQQSAAAQATRAFGAR